MEVVGTHVRVIPVGLITVFHVPGPLTSQGFGRDLQSLGFFASSRAKRSASAFAASALSASTSASFFALRSTPKVVAHFSLIRRSLLHCSSQKPVPPLLP